VEVNLPGAKGGLVPTRRAGWTNDGTDIDAWHSVRFQSVRTAFGMLLFSEKNGTMEAEARALKMVDLALSAPQRYGIFPGIFSLDTNTRSGQWFPDSGWAGYADCYHAYDCSWTGCWLLAVAGYRADYRDRIVRFLEPYAHFLLANQFADGSIPSFYDARSMAHRPNLAPPFAAETGASALFLARFYNLVRKEEYLLGAKRAITFLYERILPARKWRDFETFLARSRKPFDAYDLHTLQHPQSTLCMLAAASASLELFRITRNRLYLNHGTTILDYFSLQQQVWSPPFFERELFGGIGVQNTDVEWSDARACYASDLYFDYYDETGNIEYRERGVAALHSAFSILPYENWAGDEPGSLSSFHWGLGSAATSLVLNRKRFGDVLVDLDREEGFSLNGLEIRNLMIQKYRISFDLIGKSNRATVKFRGMKYGVYHLSVNGRLVGTKAASDLKGGIQVTPKRG